LQWAKSEEKINFNDLSLGRTSSPVHVVQRTWESRSRDVQERDKSISPRSRSISPEPPTPRREEKKSGTTRTTKSKFLKERQLDVILNVCFSFIKYYLIKIINIIVIKLKKD